jgi:uncharacterized membrane protein YcaP (DUF421 family)
MTDFITALFGEGDKLTIGQMTARAVCMFFLALVLIRVSGRRTFGKQSPFDVIIYIMLGALLSRGITGASPFWATVIASAAMVFLHRLIGWLSVRHHWIGRITKGEKILLFKEGKIYTDNLKRACISENDLKEGIRKEIQQDSFDEVDSIYMENDGKLSIVKK